MRESGSMVMNKDDYVAASLGMIRPKLRRSQTVLILSGITFAAVALLLQEAIFKGFVLGMGVAYVLFGALMNRAWVKSLRQAADDPGSLPFYVPYRIRFDESTFVVQRDNGVMGSYPWGTFHKLELRKDRLTIRPALNLIIWAERHAFQPEDWKELLRIARSQGKRFSEA